VARKYEVQQHWFSTPMVTKGESVASESLNIRPTALSSWAVGAQLTRRLTS
jgi:hypothetical protein